MAKTAPKKPTTKAATKAKTAAKRASTTPRTSNSSKPTRKSTSTPTTASVTKKKPRTSLPKSAPLQPSQTSTSPASDSASAATPVDAPPILQETTCLISWRAYKTWSPPTPSVLSDITTLLSTSRAPILSKFRKESARAEAHAALSRISGRLETQFNKARIPLQGKDTPLSYDTLVHKTAEYEAVLEPTLRHVGELERELERLKEKLKEDEQALAVLQKNAKGHEAVRREQERGMPKVLKVEGVTDDAEGINMVEKENLVQGSAYNWGMDRELAPAVGQLTQHLLSMQANTTQLRELPDAVLRGQMAVEEVLVRAGGGVRNRVMGL
ncbi:CENP-Q, a CENPA-CAD centromere complex subunit-domain-containing protein [Pyronema domesticum]|nr:CENP-Q, a CENPA-CAD centromere complex subunit-domain-containing protein [Pyronema domesticum]